MSNDSFPRDLRTAERELLLWLLPSERPAYAAYRPLIEQWKVVAQGRRGTGNYILASRDERPDNESPLPSVFAYGVVETGSGEVSVTLRERLGNQVEFEIAILGKGDTFDLNNEKRRWTFSRWLPGAPCPKCESAVRQVPMETEAQRRLVLALCGPDRRLWVYDDATGINHPIPVTNFYNELMAHKGIRDPDVALNPRRLFDAMADFTDGDLVKAFRTYNQLRTKVVLDTGIRVPVPRRRSFLQRVFPRLGKTDEG